jgi:hypothetical protein
MSFTSAPISRFVYPSLLKISCLSLCAHSVYVGFQIGGCQYYKWEDEMGETATPIQVVSLQAVAAPGGFPTAPPLAILQEGS